MAGFLLIQQQDVENHFAARALRRERVFRDRRNPLDFMTDEELISNYRLNRHCILHLCDELRNDLKYLTRRNYAISVEIQILTALKFYGTGSFQKVIGQGHGIHISTVSRCITRVSLALCRRVNNYVKFPLTEQEQRAMKQKFHDYAMFPNTLGAVDGSLIPIKKPSEDEHLYLCRKGFHAINIQAIAEPSRKILSAVVQYPGATHDSYIWDNCALSAKFQNGEIDNGWLLGDSGYPLLPFLLTPVKEPRNRGEERYNSRHKRARSVVEQAFGLLKMRFLCLHKYGGCLVYSPQKCLRIITACIVLHNICIDYNIAIPENELDEDNAEPEEPEMIHDERQSGLNVRNELIRLRFAD